VGYHPPPQRPLTWTNEGQGPRCVSDQVRPGPAKGGRAWSGSPPGPCTPWFVALLGSEPLSSATTEPDQPLQEVLAGAIARVADLHGELEGSDPTGARWRRYKASDDATAAICLPS
jgi:hypothetical protein